MELLINTAKLKRRKSRNPDFCHILIQKKLLVVAVLVKNTYRFINLTNKKQKVKSVTFSNRFTFLHFYKYLIFAKKLNV